MVTPQQQEALYRQGKVNLAIQAHKQGHIKSFQAVVAIEWPPRSCTVPAQNIGLKNEAIELHINIQIAPKFDVIGFRALRFNLSQFGNYLNSVGGVAAAEGGLA